MKIEKRVFEVVFSTKEEKSGEEMSQWREEITQWETEKRNHGTVE